MTKCVHNFNVAQCMYLILVFGVLDRELVLVEDLRNQQSYIGGAGQKA